MNAHSRGLGTAQAGIDEPSMGHRHSQIRSVPAHFTNKKQKGKSKTLSRKYTPTADHPYSRESFFKRPLKDSESSAFAPPAWARRDHDQLKFLFCVLDSNLPVEPVVAFLHMVLRNNGPDADHPTKPAVGFALVAFCVLCVDSVLALVLFFHDCVASLWKGELVMVAVRVANGGRPSAGVRSARSMLLSQCPLRSTTVQRGKCRAK